MALDLHNDNTILYLLRRAMRELAPSFTTAEKRENISAGEKLETLFGKISRWLADLKTVAFTGRYSDLTETPTIPAASTATPKAPGAAAAGSAMDWARGDHVHPAQTSVENAATATTADKVAHALNFTGAVKDSYDGSANKTVNIPDAVSVKGNSESVYRTGKVNLTPANIGALPTTGGVASGHLAVLAKSGDSYVSVHNSDTDAIVSLSAATDGGVGVYSSTFNQWLIKKNSDGSFSLCGVKGPFLQKEAAAAKVAHALTFTGAVTDSYDGSANKTVNIPEPSLYMEEIGGVHLMGASEKFNDLGSGLFRWTTNLTDTTKPYPSGVGIAVMQSENAGVQLVFALTTATLHVQIRRKRSGTWEAWQNVQLSAASADEPMPGPEVVAEEMRNYEL